MLVVPRLAVIFLSFALVGASDLTGARAGTSTAPGAAYTMHAVSTPVGEGAMAAAMEAQRANWTGSATYAAGRGRLDITDGKGGVFQQGDWLLFDREDFVIVHQADKTFSRLPSQFDPASAMAAAGLNVSIKGVTVSLDTLAGSDTLDGHATSRYRLTAAYTMTIDMAGLAPAGAQLPPMETKQTSDYWYADVADAPVPPFVSGWSDTRRSGGGVMHDLTDKIAAAMRGLPTAKFVLKVASSTRISGGPMLSGGVDNMMEITNLKRADVDLDRLVLPADFTEVEMPGAAALAGGGAAKDAATKWRTRPGG